MTGVLKSEEGAIHLHPKRMENPRLQRLKRQTGGDLSAYIFAWLEGNQLPKNDRDGLKTVHKR